MYIVQYRFMMQVLFYVDLTICESSKCLSLVMEISWYLERKYGIRHPCEWRGPVWWALKSSPFLLLSGRWLCGLLTLYEYPYFGHMTLSFIPLTALLILLMEDMLLFDISNFWLIRFLSPSASAQYLSTATK